MLKRTKYARVKCTVLYVRFFFFRLFVSSRHLGKERERERERKKNYENRTCRRDAMYVRFFRSSPRDVMILFYVPSGVVRVFLRCLISRQPIHTTRFRIRRTHSSCCYVSLHLLFIVSCSVQPLTVLPETFRDCCNESARHHRPRILSYSGTHAWLPPLGSRLHRKCSSP